MDLADRKHEDPSCRFRGREIYAMGYVRDTGSARGRGVYAARDIEPGEIVEVCPVLFVASRFDELPVELKRAVFAWGPLTGIEGNVIALGYGGIYNHANPANLAYAADAEARCLLFRAAVAIPAGAELTINFNCLEGGTTSSDDSWFRAVGLEPFPSGGGD
jgi:hypothetical protein